MSNSYWCMVYIDTHSSHATLSSKYFMKTIPQGDNGDVLAPFGSRDHLIRGKRVLLRITGKSSDQKVPHIIKDGLIGVQIEAVFTKDQLVRQIGSSCKKLPDNCMIVYIE